MGKSTFVNALGADEARRRLHAHLAEADHHLSAALKGRQGTRSFVRALFAQGAPDAFQKPGIGAMIHADAAAAMAGHDARVG